MNSTRVASLEAQSLSETYATALKTLSTIENNSVTHTISIVGSMNADYTVTTERLPLPGETLTGGPLTILAGGKSGNQAASAARIGGHVHLFGAVGTDSNADFLLGKLADSGVHTEAIKHVEGPSGTTVITVDSAGENTIVYSPGSNAAVTSNYIAEHTDELAHSQVLGLCLESPLEAVTTAARICHNAGIPVLLNNSPFQEVIPDELIKNCDILLINEHEMAQLLKITPPENEDWLSLNWDEVMLRMQDYGFEMTVITLGGEGSIVFDHGAARHVLPAHIDPVDTTGCGDAFMGTILAGLSAGYSLMDSAQLASYVSGYAALRLGAQSSYGTAEDIREFIAQQ